MFNNNNLGYCNFTQIMYPFLLMGKETLDDRMYNNFLRVIEENFEGKPGKLARALNVKASFISDIIHKRRKLSNNYAERISTLIGVDPAEFYKGPHTRMITSAHEEHAIYIAREAAILGPAIVNQIEVVNNAIIEAAKKKEEPGSEGTKGGVPRRTRKRAG